jgi:hypothetical protein
VLLGVVLAALAMTGTVSSASAVTASPATGLQPAAATGSPVVAGQACPDVMVIGARGTNEGPTTNPDQLSSYATDQYKGVGQDIDSMYQDLVTANPQLRWGLEPAIYATNVNLVTFARDVAKYPADAATGAESIALDIQTTDATCGSRVHYILAGYSLGAWAVHDALLNQLTSVLGEITGVALFGDPKFIPFQPIVREYWGQDHAFGIATAVPDADDIPPGIPATLVPHTGSWCLPADPICQDFGVPPGTWATELAGCAVPTAISKSSLCAHYQYWEAESADAAAFLQPFLPPPVPIITSVGTYTQGVYVYFDIHYADPGNDAEGFGFVGANGSGWAEENHPFNSPSYGIVGPDSIAYPFNQLCGTAQQYDSYVEAWIYDTAGDRSTPVVIHLVCT